MKIGLGLPNAVPYVPEGRLLVRLAKSAETLGFSSLATIGRIAYPNYEEMVTLAAAAGATERIGLFTDILLGPTREPILLAKQAASLDQLSGGRLTLGVAVGMRVDDFTTTGHDFHTRGRRWDASLELIQSAWRGEPVPGTERSVTPRPVNGHSVPMLFGGQSEQTIRRLVKYGDGFTLGGGTPDQLRQAVERVSAAWSAAGREGRPEVRALAYFVLGEDAQEQGERNLRDYYGGYGDRVWGGAVKTADEAKARAAAFADAGCDELLFFCAAPLDSQPERLAEAVL
jgi:alkanesulfonate monooxygenase SsuD/methylene tetrahydromethanopterin reductase-like flavin-dependent oxidoreductase (luciferase family)